LLTPRLTPHLPNLTGKTVGTTGQTAGALDLACFVTRLVLSTFPITKLTCLKEIGKVVASAYGHR
jgi:hypothetical protein